MYAAGGSASGQLDSLVSAIGATEVQIEARLGRAEISLADLRGLRTGDILVLDTAIEQGASLSVAGQQIARASLTEVDGRHALSVQP